MMARILMFLFAFVPFITAVQAVDVLNPLKTWLGWQPTPQPPKIKVLILHDKDGAILEAFGAYKIFDPHTGSQLSTRFLGKTKLIQPLDHGLKWGEEFPGHHQIELVATASDTKFLVNGVEYKDALAVYDIGGAISIVNEIPIEEYLSIILNSKYSKDLPEEALAALAIAERTNTYYLAQHPKKKFWGVDGAITGYQGHYAVDPNDPMQKAIRNTRYMVMSRTGNYEGVVTPFPAQWNPSSSKVTLEEVEQMAQKGNHAAAILEKAFPHTIIQFIY